MRAFAWTFLICAVLSTIGVFVPCVEVPAASATFGRRTSLSLYQAMFNSTVIDSVTYQQLPIDAVLPLPYFGMNVEVVDQDGVMSADLWVPLCKVMGNVPFPVQYGKYWRMKVQAQFILCKDVRYPYFFDIIEHAAVTAPTIPPTYS